jgi:hypothetical protein
MQDPVTTLHRRLVEAEGEVVRLMAERDALEARLAAVTEERDKLEELREPLAKIAEWCNVAVLEMGGLRAKPLPVLAHTIALRLDQVYEALLAKEAAETALAAVEGITALLTHRAGNGFIQHKYNGADCGFHPVGMAGCKVCDALSPERSPDA